MPERADRRSLVVFFIGLKCYIGLLTKLVCGASHIQIKSAIFQYLIHIFSIMKELFGSLGTSSKFPKTTLILPPDVGKQHENLQNIPIYGNSFVTHVQSKSGHFYLRQKQGLEILTTRQITKNRRTSFFLYLLVFSSHSVIAA